MEYVLDENGNIKIGPNGKPLVKGDDGKEFEIDAIGAQSKINTLVEESNGRRKKLGEATTTLEALTAENNELKTTVAGIDDKNKVKIDDVKASINKIWEEKEEAWNTEKTSLENKLFNETTGSKFATSKAIKTTVLPTAAAKAYFGGFFQKDGTCHDRNGNVINSKENPGEPAGFEESINYLIESDPEKDSLLRSNAGNGSNGHSTNDGGNHDKELSAEENISAGLKAF